MSDPRDSVEPVSVEHPEKTPGQVYGILALGLLSISFSPILVRFATDAPGLAIAVWRTVFAALIIGIVALVQVGRRPLASVRRKHAPAILAASAFLALHFILWIESLYHTSVASASVLVSTTPIFLGVLGFVVLRERLPLPVIAAIVVGVAGAGLIAAGDTGASVIGTPDLGNGLALSASFAAAVYLLIGSVVRKRLDWLSYVAPLYALVALIVVVVALARGVPLLTHSLTFYALCMGMAVGPQVMGHGSFNYVIRYISPTLLGLLILLEPVVSSILAYFLFDEVPGNVAIGGMVMVLLSVALAVLASRRRP